MDKNVIETKQWFTDGATMIYPGRFRTAFWLINLLLYILLNMFNLRVQLGQYLIFQPIYHSGPLIPDLLSPINIFQHPAYIFIAAIIMAMLTTIPILIAQLYNLLFALPFIVAVFFFGHNPVLALALLVSVSMVSFEPLRFKSKFVATLIAMIPPILYWIFYSGENPEQDLLRWALLYAPWALASIIAVLFFSLTLTVGHFLRYRPGVLMPFFAAMIALTIVLFHQKISLHERDFQADVMQFSPQQIPEFRTRSIMPLITQELQQKQLITPFLTEDTLRSQLRAEWYDAFRIAAQGARESDAGMTFFANNPASLARREVNKVRMTQIRAIDHINVFLNNNRHKNREPDALYYLALLHDLKVDHHALLYEDTLQFYWNIPSQHTTYIWQDIIERYPDHPASIEARWRLAWLKAAVIPDAGSEAFLFRQAADQLRQAETLCLDLLKLRQQSQQVLAAPGKFASLFREPEPTINNIELRNLQQRIGLLTILISEENRTGHEKHDIRLARFVGLDPALIHYEEQLKKLLLDSPQPDPLIDNIELAQVLLEKNSDALLARLNNLAVQYPSRDAGIQARLIWTQKIIQQKSLLPPEAWPQLQSQAIEALQAIIASASYAYFQNLARTLLEALNAPPPQGK